MQVFNKYLIDDIVYWAPAGYDSSSQRTFAAGVQIPGRWIDDNVLFTDANGNPATSKAFCYVNQALVALGFLWKGSLTSLSPAQVADPRKVKGAWEIRRFSTKTSLSKRGVAGQTEFKAFM
jgi:hypothetical protein